MNKPNLSNLVDASKLFIARRSPEILTGIGIAGMVTTTVLAVKATPKALILIDQAENEMERDLKPIETIKVAWKPYIPAIVTGTMSTMCLIGASSVNLRRNAALATAYKLSETAFAEYKEQVIKTVGEKKEQHVRDKIAEEKVKNNPVSKSEVIVTNDGKTLCYDPISGRYFYSKIDTIKRAELKIREDILKSFSGYASLNDFYDEIDLPRTSMGDDLGWNIEHNIEIHFSSQLNDNGEPSLVLDFTVAPQYDYYKYS